MTIDRQALLQAINDLIQEPDPRFKIEALAATLPVARRYPINMSAELAVLDPLLQLMVTDPESFKNMQKLVDEKRQALNKEPCWPEPGKPKFDKNTYQAQLMRTRRGYASRALKIENDQRPSKDALVGSARLDFEGLQLAKWGEKLDAVEKAARFANGGPLTQAALRQIKDQFWEQVSASLDAAEEATRREMLKPIHMRRKIDPHQ